MAERGRVPLLDRRDGGVHEPLEEVLDLRVELAVLDGHRRLAGEGGDEFDRPPRERHDLALHVRRRGEHGLEVALAVDELQHADDLFLVVLHRNHEHRLGAVAVPLVEGAVDAVFDVGRQEVGVVEDQGLARDRGVPGEAGAVDGHREFDERRLGLGVGLGQPEAQPLLPLAARFHEVEAARVRLGDATRLCEDEVEQGLQIALGPEGDADAGELADLAAARRRLVAGARRLHPRRPLPEPGAHRDEQLPRPGGVPHEARQQLRGHLLGHVRLPVAPQRHDGAARVHERPQHVQGEERTAFGIEHQHRGALVHRELPGQTQLAPLHLRPLEDRGHAAGLPGGWVQQQVSHGLSLVAMALAAFAVFRGARRGCMRLGGLQALQPLGGLGVLREHLERPIVHVDRLVLLPAVLVQQGA